MHTVCVHIAHEFYRFKFFRLFFFRHHRFHEHVIHLCSKRK